jgi:hypothetical protein
MLGGFRGTGFGLVPTLALNATRGDFERLWNGCGVQARVMRYGTCYFPLVSAIDLR